MLPIVKISSATLQSLLLYLAIIGFLLVVSTIIRLKVAGIRKIFIPASLLAGIIGMALGLHMLKIIPADMMSSIGALPGQLINIMFACMLLGIKKQAPSKGLSHNVVAGLGWLYACSFLQVGIICLLCVVLFIPVFNIDPMFGSVFEVGFAGGHGTAGGMVEVYNLLGWPCGGDIGKTTATIGLLAGIFGGIAIINYGVRKHYTKILTELSSGSNSKEIFSEAERQPSSYTTVNHDVVEPFALHFGIIGIAVLIGRIIVWVFMDIFNYVLPLFPFAMIGGWILNSIIQRTFLRDLFERNTFQRIQGIALEVLIISAMASISIPVVLTYWAPLLIGSLFMMAMMISIFFWLSPRVFTDNWFEHGIIRYGAFTGVAAVGYMLLRVCDPQMETDAGQVYALGSPFMSPFIGGGLITTAYPMLLQRFGALTTGVALCSWASIIILLMRLFFWNAHSAQQQR